jgi:DNA-binding transcriptional MocR family regulator
VIFGRPPATTPPAQGRLPTRNELAKTYDVAPMTVQNALRELREEGLIVSRQGRGVFVRERTERPVGLRPHVERAFDTQKVTIDFASLVPDTTVPMAIPCQVDDLADSPEFRARATEIMRRNTLAIEDNVTELQDLGLINETVAEVRVHRATPLFKLYQINNEEAFFSFNPVRERVISLNGHPRAIYDLMGKDAILFHHSITDNDTSTGSQYVDQARTWFDSM